jgi:hypothetical protein
MARTKQTARMSTGGVAARRSAPENIENPKALLKSPPPASDINMDTVFENIQPSIIQFNGYAMASISDLTEAITALEENDKATKNEMIYTLNKEITILEDESRTRFDEYIRLSGLEYNQETRQVQYEIFLDLLDGLIYAHRGRMLELDVVPNRDVPFDISKYIKYLLNIDDVMYDRVFETDLVIKAIQTIKALKQRSNQFKGDLEKEATHRIELFTESQVPKEDSKAEKKDKGPLAQLEKSGLHEPAALKRRGQSEPASMQISNTPKSSGKRSVSAHRQPTPKRDKLEPNASDANKMIAELRKQFVNKTEEEQKSFFDSDDVDVVFERWVQFNYPRICASSQADIGIEMANTKTNDVQNMSRRQITQLAKELRKLEGEFSNIKQMNEQRIQYAKSKQQDIIYLGPDILQRHLQLLFKDAVRKHKARHQKNKENVLFMGSDEEDDADVVKKAPKSQADIETESEEDSENEEKAPKSSAAAQPKRKQEDEKKKKTNVDSSVKQPKVEPPSADALVFRLIPEVTELKKHIQTYKISNKGVYASAINNKNITEIKERWATDIQLFKNINDASVIRHALKQMEQLEYKPGVRNIPDAFQTYAKYRTDLKMLIGYAKKARAWLDEIDKVNKVQLSANTLLQKFKIELNDIKAKCIEFIRKLKQLIQDTIKMYLYTIKPKAESDGITQSVRRMNLDEF